MIKKLMEKLAMARKRRDSTLMEMGSGVPRMQTSGIFGEKPSQQEMDRRQEAECHRGSEDKDWEK